MDTRDLDKLQVLGAQLAVQTNLDTLCLTLCEWLNDTCQAPQISLYLRTGNVLAYAPNNCEAQHYPTLALGMGLIGQAALELTPAYYPNVNNTPHYIAGSANTQSEYVVPIVYRSELLGVLDCQHTQQDGINPVTRKRLDAAATLAAPHISALLDDTSASADFRHVVAELAHLPMATETDLQVVFGTITERAVHLLSLSRANIWMFGEDSLRCVDQYDIRTNIHIAGEQFTPPSLDHYIRTLDEERVIVAVDVTRDPRIEFALTYFQAHNIVSSLATPIRQDGEIVGVICLEQTNQRTWTNEEISFAATLSDLATIALTNHKKCLAESALIQAQKMESLGRLAGGIAHDFNNLLTVISGAAETMQLGDSTPSQARMLQLIVDAGSRANSLTRNLMAFGGRQQLKVDAVSLSSLMNGVRALTEGLIREDIQINFVIDHQGQWVGNESTQGDQVQLEQVLLNLIINAADAMPDGGVLTITGFVCRNTGQLALAVEDTGHGIRDAIKSKIFDPFFSTKGDGGGGLGLSMSMGIVKQHGGTLTCTHSSPAGTRFDIRLPLNQADNNRHKVHEHNNGANNLPTHQQVLLVEDEHNVRTVVEQMLTGLGFRPLVAENAVHALDIIAQTDIHLLLTDVIMPDMRGPELYQAAQRTQPDLKVLFVSGYAEDVLNKIEQGQVGFLAKPFTLSQLKTALAQIMLSPPEVSDEKHPPANRSVRH